MVGSHMEFSHGCIEFKFSVFGMQFVSVMLYSHLCSNVQVAMESQSTWHVHCGGCSYSCGHNNTSELYLAMM